MTRASAGYRQISASNADSDPVRQTYKIYDLVNTAADQPRADRQLFRCRIKVFAKRNCSLFSRTSVSVPLPVMPTCNLYMQWCQRSTHPQKLLSSCARVSAATTTAAAAAAAATAYRNSEAAVVTGCNRGTARQPSNDIHAFVLPSACKLFLHAGSGRQRLCHGLLHTSSGRSVLDRGRLTEHAHHPGIRTYKIVMQHEEGCCQLFLHFKVPYDICERLWMWLAQSTCPHVWATVVSPKKCPILATKLKSM